MKKIFIVGLILISLLLLACSPKSQLPSEEGFDDAAALAGQATKLKFSPVDSCSKSADTDSSEFVKGTLQFMKKGKSYSYDDKCSKNGLIEYYCKDGKGITRAGVKCETKCVDGACVKGCPSGATCYDTQQPCAADQFCSNGYCSQKGPVEGPANGKCSAVICKDPKQVYVNGNCVDSKGVYTCTCTKESGCDSGYGYVSYYNGFVLKTFSETNDPLFTNKDWTCTLNKEPMPTVCDNSKSDVVGGYLATDYTAYGYLKKASCTAIKSSAAPDVNQGMWLHSVSCDLKINVLSHGFTECNCVNGVCLQPTSSSSGSGGSGSGGGSGAVGGGSGSGFKKFTIDVSKSWKVHSDSSYKQNNILELANSATEPVQGESIAQVEQFIGYSDLSILGDTQLKTTLGQYPATQYLYLGKVPFDDTTSIVKFAEDDSDVTNVFFYVRSGRNIGEYVLEFNSAAESTIQDVAGAASSTGTLLDDFDHATITILGKKYTVVSAERPQKNAIKLLLMRGEVEDNLLEGESKIFQVGGQKYDVMLNSLDSKYAEFTVAGQKTGKLQKGGWFHLGNNVYIALSDILYQSYAGGVHKADFFLGATSLLLEDDNIVDKKNSKPLRVFTETINGADVSIEGSDDNTMFTLTKIRVNMTAQDDYFVPKGEVLSTAIHQQGDERELLFTNSWDVMFDGLTQEKTHSIKLTPVTDTRYALTFFDGDGNQVAMPLLVLHNGAVLFAEVSDKWVNLDESDLISKDSYLVLTTGDSSKGTAKSYALQYKGNFIFKNLGDGSAIDASSGSIKIGGKTFLVNGPAENLHVDLNGDGIIGTNSVNIIDFYGSEWSFNGGGNEVVITQNTPNQDSYEDVKPATLEFKIVGKDGKLTIGSFKVNGQVNPSLTPEGEKDVGYGYTSMGAKWTYKTPLNAPAEFYLESPEKQRLPQVYIGPVK